MMLCNVNMRKWGRDACSEGDQLVQEIKTEMSFHVKVNRYE